MNTPCSFCSLLAPCVSNHCVRLSFRLTFFCPREHLQLPVHSSSTDRKRDDMIDVRFSISSSRHKSVYDSIRSILTEDQPLTVVKQLTNIVTACVAEQTVLILEESLLSHLSNLKLVFQLLSDLNVGHSVRRVDVISNFSLVSQTFYLINRHLVFWKYLTIRLLWIVHLSQNGRHWEIDPSCELDHTIFISNPEHIHQ